MDASHIGDRDQSVLDELRALKQDLESSQDNDVDDSEVSGASGKRLRPEMMGASGAAANNGKGGATLGNRKRDVKGNYKAKFNIEKLMIEHEKKKMAIDELLQKKDEMEKQLTSLQDDIGSTRTLAQIYSSNTTDDPLKAQASQQPGANLLPQQKYHWDFLIKEMKWMAEDFERETKKKVGDARKNVRACKKQLQEKKLKKEKELKDMKHEVKKRAQNMSKMVQQFWRSIEKVVKHNYNVLYEKKRQAQRTKKLESFVSKHLKLSVKVAETLNTKSFIEQSMHKDNLPKVQDEQNAEIKAALETEEQGVEKVFGKDSEPEDPIKRRKVLAFKEPTDLVESDKKYFAEDKGLEVIDTSTAQVYNGGQNNSQANHYYGSQQHQALVDEEEKEDPDHPHMTRASIAEQAVEMAKSFQPTGTTLQAVDVKTKVPFLLNGQLREYQIIGLDWMVTLHNQRLNGILADEMGLGKTIQTISLLASLACDKGVWGPHLIVVPTTIIINWEMEFKKWCPAFKILTYFGSQKERKMKRHGWSRENSFHVCITSYKLVIQDHFAFRRKKWYYMILDEAQNIKNFKSQRWQTLLRFNTKRRLLLTGTPLQNDVMELWSLMHFLMPNIFSSQQDFKEWFSNPFNQSITQNQSLNISVIQKLQSILRPFLLRRLKRDVEKQLPEKVEHIVQCNLSRRQRLLYDEYINSDKTKQTLNDSDFFSIMNVLMQLRKVCNHPDLFEARTIESPFIMQERISYHFPSVIYKDCLQYKHLHDVNLRDLNFVLSDFETLSRYEYATLQQLYPKRPLIQVIAEHKNEIDHLSERLQTTRPLADGLALGKRLPVNGNFLARSNTKALRMTTLPQVLPYATSTSVDGVFKTDYHYLEDEVPPYLNAACLPFVQEYYSIENFDEMRWNVNNGYGTKHSDSSRGFPKYSEYQAYLSALRDEEERKILMRFALKLIQWRSIDQTNRTNLIIRKPVFGEDCRKAVKVNLVFQDVFDTKRHKNLDRENAYNQAGTDFALNDLDRAPSTVFNAFANHTLWKDSGILKRNIIEDWAEQTEQEIENAYYSTDPVYSQRLIKEVPMSLQISNKRRKQLLKQQLLLQQQQLREKQLQEEEERKRQELEAKRKAEEEKALKAQEDEAFEDTGLRNISIIIDMKRLRMPETRELSKENPCVEVRCEKVLKLKEKPVKIQPPPDIEDQPMPLVYEPLQALVVKQEKFPDEVDGATKVNTPDQQMQDIIQESNKEPASSEVKNERNIIEEQKVNILDEEIKESPIKDEAMIEQQQISENQNNNGQQDEEEKKQESIALKQPEIPKKESNQKITYRNCEVLRDFIITPLQRVAALDEEIKHFKFIIPKVVSKPVEFIPTKIVTKHQKEKAYERFAYQKLMSHRNVHQSLKHSNILFFPHKNLIQYDCGKLQRLATLLKHLHMKGHKVLIFTQMTRILDVLENFLNLHGYTYVRLDGSVKVEMRQRMVDKFNLNKKIFCFISSTRCGGIGINLTGADCVIFYDTDWNPAMDKQAQDRCHRIGQTKTVHIYRLISVNTIEENIFKKSLQKRDFGGLIIEGNFDMEIFMKKGVTLKDILEDDSIFKPKRRDLLKEENIVFHTNANTLTDEIIITQQNNNAQSDPSNMIDFEKQRELEQYRKRFEEALVRIEDKEDVIALQQARREIDDEFVEEDPAAQEANKSHEQTEGASTTEGQGGALTAPLSEDDEMELNAKATAHAAELESKSAGGLQRDIMNHRNEFINWREHSTLNNVTKLCIDYFENNYSFDAYLDDRSKKDNKFVNPLAEIGEEGEGDHDEEKQESDFSMSGDEEEENSHDGGQEWNPTVAEELYKRTRDEVDQHYFVE